MKALITYFHADGSVTEGVVPDSAVTRCKDPFFLPDEGDYKAMLLRGVRIDRLGKGIAREYADRYYSECLTATHQFRVASEPSDTIRRWSSDGALTVSQCGPKDGMSPESVATVNALIEKISRYSTLKTGDLVLFGMEKDTFPLSSASKDYIVEATDGFPQLKLKVR